MPDSTLETIDRFFDLVDNGVEKIDQVLNRGERTVKQQRVRRSRREFIDAEVAEVPKGSRATKVTPTTLALVRAPRFYIVESITPTGTLFVVTDGGNARTECSTREFAEKILRALEKAT